MIASVLLDHGARLDPRDHRTAETLLEAIDTAHVGTVRILLDHGAPVTARDNRGSALAHAVMTGRPSIVTFLLERGAKADARDGSLLEFARLRLKNMERASSREEKRRGVEGDIRIYEIAMYVWIHCRE